MASVLALASVTIMASPAAATDDTCALDNAELCALLDTITGPPGGSCEPACLSTPTRESCEYGNAQVCELIALLEANDFGPPEPGCNPHC